jgi:biopolymer transport protein ExbD
MITRPLELASRLRREPRNFDWMFYVNAGLIAVFFSVFGSRFVLAPGIAALPAVVGSNANARMTTHYISVHSEQQIFAGDGLRDLKGLSLWLNDQAKSVKNPVLLVQSNEGVPLDLIARIMSAAQSAGFFVQIASTEPSGRRATSPGR